MITFTGHDEPGDEPEPGDKTAMSNDDDKVCIISREATLKDSNSAKST
jgi:hypothetical protein